MKLELYNKNIYGINQVYVKDAKLAKAIELISGKKTITTSMQVGLADLGFEFEFVIAPV